MLLLISFFLPWVYIDASTAKNYAIQPVVFGKTILEKHTEYHWLGYIFYLVPIAALVFILGVFWKFHIKRVTRVMRWFPILFLCYHAYVISFAIALLNKINSGNSGTTVFFGIGILVFIVGSLLLLLPKSKIKENKMATGTYFWQMDFYFGILLFALFFFLWFNISDAFYSTAKSLNINFTGWGLMRQQKIHYLGYLMYLTPLFALLVALNTVVKFIPNVYIQFFKWFIFMVSFIHFYTINLAENIIFSYYKDNDFIKEFFVDMGKTPALYLVFLLSTIMLFRTNKGKIITK